MDIFFSGGLFSFLTLFKAFLILAVIFYAVFSFLVLKQVNATNHTIHTQESRIFRFLSIVNMGASLAALILVFGLIISGV